MANLSPVQYVTTLDGFALAYTVSGAGPPLIYVPSHMNHLLLTWQWPYLRPWLERLEERFTLVRYDSRGMGLSTRGLPTDHSFEAYQVDLETVREAVQVAQFVLCGAGTGSPTALAYAARNPDRVSALIVWGGGVRSAGELLFRDLPELDWDVFLQSAARSNISDVPGIVDLLKQCVSQQDWLRAVKASSDDLEATLSSLRVPTLVLHPRENLLMPLEKSIRLAQITDGQLVVIDGADSMGDAKQGMAAIDAFLKQLPRGEAKSSSNVVIGDGLDVLSPRQIEVLRLVVSGMTTREIADKLVLSERTVERHIADVYAKIGARNRAEAIVFALNRLHE
ncbi:MAG TPA: alpha/beta fold hydrolase [Dehalococcoidia bacterium]|nr:alpha/beta fold hydrolase [Dehalococcoidia bacterium]